MKTITRSEAASQRLRKYFTGKKCRNGHISERYTLSGSCVSCTILRVNSVRAVYREALNG
jgi:hypothetical protein